MGVSYPNWIQRAVAIATLAAACLRGAEPKAPDPDLPGTVDPGVARSLLESPPFTRAINLSDSLELTGVALVQGKPVATVRDRRDNKTHLVSDQPNEKGWRLAEATPGVPLRQAGVKIVVGGEVIPIHYVEPQILKSAVRGGSSLAHVPTPQEFTGRDEKGEYVRGVPYLSDADRDKFRNIPRDVREKFLNAVHDQRDMLFKASHEERAAFVKKTFDSIVGR